MEKVYLVTYETDDWWNIQYICDSFLKATDKKAELEKHIQNIKTYYYLEYNSDYDSDLEKILGEDLIMEDENLYEELVDKVYIFQAKYNELRYNNINIEEREVI